VGWSDRWRCEALADRVRGACSADASAWAALRALCVDLSCDCKHARFTEVGSMIMGGICACLVAYAQSRRALCVLLML
jgi:hypothetical protein